MFRIIPISGTFLKLFNWASVNTYVVVFTIRLTAFCGKLGLRLLGVVFPKAVTTRPLVSSNDHGQRFSLEGGLVDQNV
jgi:hypothetical protein